VISAFIAVLLENTHVPRHRNSCGMRVLAIDLK